MLSSSACALFRNILRPQSATMVVAPLDICAQRGRKRCKKLGIPKAERLKRRQLKEEKEANRRRFTYVQRVRMSKVGKSLSLQWPGRYDEEADAKKPDSAMVGGIYLADQMRTKFFPFEQALEMHRRIQCPTIFGRPDVVVQLRVELNMGTDRAAKFIGDSRQLVALPHPFKHNEKRTLMAFAASQEMQQQALEAGADIALGQDAIKKILKGRFNIDDYDFCVAHEDMAHHITSLRGVLKARFPTRINEALGADLIGIIGRFLNGINLAVRQDPANKLWGLCAPNIGRLDMPTEQLVANLETVLAILFKQRNPALGPYINRCCVLTEPPNGSAFPVDVHPWEPVATEAEQNKIKRKKKKKKKKLTTDELLSLGEEEEMDAEPEEDGEPAAERLQLDDEDTEAATGGGGRGRGKRPKNSEKQHPLGNLDKFDRKALLNLM